MSNFWDIIADIFYIFIFVAYLMVLFRIFLDIFGDHSLAGGWKAVWIIALVFAPIISALVYMIARGRGMAERQIAAMRQRRATQTLTSSMSPARWRQVPGRTDRGCKGTAGQRRRDRGRVQHPQVQGPGFGMRSESGLLRSGCPTT